MNDCIRFVLAARFSFHASQSIRCHVSHKLSTYQLTHRSAKKLHSQNRRVLCDSRVTSNNLCDPQTVSRPFQQTVSSTLCPNQARRNFLYDDKTASDNFQKNFYDDSAS